MLKQVNVEIEGVRPLMVNRPPDERKDAYDRTKRDRKIEDNIEEKLYKNNEGKCILLAEHVYQALIAVGSRFKPKGIKYMTYKKLIEAYVIIEPEQIIINPQKWDVDRRSAVIPTTGGRIMVERPIFKEWTLNFKINYEDSTIEENTLKQVLELAGAINGLGTYRPRFGLFKVTKWLQIEKKQNRKEKIRLD